LSPYDTVEWKLGGNPVLKYGFQWTKGQAGETIVDLYRRTG